MTRPNPHDAGFKAFFSDPRVAADAIRRLLPERVAEAFDWGALELMPTEFIGEDLIDRRADLVFKAPLAGRSAFVFLLFEHQSSVDPLMPFRVLVYLVRTWQRWLKENPDSRRLPAVLPIVLYHGRRPWRGPTGLHELLDLPDVLRRALGRYLPAVELLLDDLTRTTDAAIEASTRVAFATAALMLLKHAAYEDDPISDRLLAHLKAALDGGAVQSVVQALHYIYNVSDVPPGPLAQRLSEGSPDDIREALMTTADRLRAEGFDRGIERGIEQGIARERAANLERLLQLKFGPLDEATRARIARADLETLRSYTDRVLEAAELDHVFR